MTALASMALIAALGWLATAAIMFVAWRFYRKAVVYDEVFQYLYGDIEINLKQFSKMATSNILADEPEVRQAHQNMMIMGKRLLEILNRMEEASGLRLRPPPPLPRPKVQ